MAPICCSCRHTGLWLERSCLLERGLCVGVLPQSNPSRLTKTVTVEPKRRCNVIWTVLGWVRNCDRRTDLWRALDARTDALDCGCAVVLLGVGILSGVKATRQKDPAE